MDVSFLICQLFIVHLNTLKYAVAHMCSDIHIIAVDLA
jgi:hypothetical protein